MDSTKTIRIPTSSAHVLHLALERELDIIQISIENTRRKLERFEADNNMTSAEFIEKFNEGSMGDSEEMMLWASEYTAFLEIRKEHGDLKKVLASWST